MIQINGSIIPDTSALALPPPVAASQCSPDTVLHPPTLTQIFKFLKFQFCHPAQVKALLIIYDTHRYGDFFHDIKVHLMGLELGHIVPI